MLGYVLDKGALSGHQLQPRLLGNLVGSRALETDPCPFVRDEPLWFEFPYKNSKHRSVLQERGICKAHVWISWSSLASLCSEGWGPATPTWAGDAEI